MSERMVSQTGDWHASIRKPAPSRRPKASMAARPRRTGSLSRPWPWSRSASTPFIMGGKIPPQSPVSSWCSRIHSSQARSARARTDRSGPRPLPAS